MQPVPQAVRTAAIAVAIAGDAGVVAADEGAAGVTAEAAAVVGATAVTEAGMAAEAEEDTSHGSPRIYTDKAKGPD